MSKQILRNEETLSLVTRSIYLDGEPDFVICLCVGYTKAELKAGGRTNARRAVEAFRELLSAESTAGSNCRIRASSLRTEVAIWINVRQSDDWEERTLQIVAREHRKVEDVQPEVMR